MASVLKVDQIQLPDGSAPTASDLGIDVSGSVVQVVSYVYASSASTSSSSWTATGMSLDITPKLSNSHLLVTVHMSSLFAGGGDYIMFKLLRNSTDVLQFEGQAGYDASSGDVSSPATSSTTYLDTTNTVANTPVTFSVQWRNPPATNVIEFNTSGAYSTMTITEIAQ